MRAVADIIESGRTEITFRAVSDASGIPERTIYRRYETKEAVLGAFWNWVNEQIGMPAPPRSTSELVEQIRAVFSAFEAGEPLVRAMLHDPQGKIIRLSGAKERRAKFRDSLEEVLGGLKPVDQRRLLASTQVLLSAAGWETMKDYWDLTSDEAADAAQWAISTLIAEAQRQGRRTHKSSQGKAGRNSRKIEKEV